MTWDMMYRPLPWLGSIVAFGPDGQVLAKECSIIKKVAWLDAYPFINDDLKAEILNDIRFGYGESYRDRDERIVETRVGFDLGYKCYLQKER